MSGFQPSHDAWEDRLRDSFSRQGLMATLGAELGTVAPGHVEILLPYREALSQQHGFFHAGATSTIADSAGGYAAFSLFPATASVLTVEFKINLVAPASGERLRAVGQVVKPGRTLTLCDVETYVLSGGREKLCAKMQQTLMCLEGRPDMPTGG